jgi:hypothetical protein
LYFNRTVDVRLLDQVGRIVRMARSANRLDLSGHAPGVYLLVTEEGQRIPILIQ